MSLSKETTCKKMIVNQKPINRTLGAVYPIVFSLSDDVLVSINQYDSRTLEFTSSKEVECEDLFCTFQSIEKLLMLFDGRFYRIEKLEFTDDNNDKSERFSSVSKELLNNRLSYFESKDFLQYFLFKLIPYQDVLNAEVYSKWKSLLEQMDITYQVLLYSTSNNKYPIDMNFAFLVELSEPFVELVKENTYLCQSLSPGERGTTLKMCVDALITHFGTDIFEKELSSGNYKSFLDNVIGSRVRIMHIKKKQGKYFEGKECIRYWMKFSILYRRIIFELLGIPYKTYEYKLKRAVKIIDELQLNYCVGG